MAYLSLTLNFLIGVVKKAANPLTRDFNEIEKLQNSVRGHQEFVRAALERVSKALRVELQKGRPNYAVMSDAGQLPEIPCFVIAPLDGVLNFMHGIPYFAVAAAIAERGEITAGVVYNPATGDLYFAEKGKGAFKEGYRSQERLRVSARKELKNCLLAASASVDGIADFRNNGSLSLDLAGLAAGRYDGVVCQGAMAGELAAGMLLVKEAGGYVYEYNQKDIRTDDQAAVLQSGCLVAGNAAVGAKLFTALHK